MKRFLVAIIVAAGVIPSGCAPITIPLQGTYEDMMYLFCNRDAEVLSVKGNSDDDKYMLELSIFNTPEIIDNRELRTYKRYRKRPDEVMMSQFNLMYRNFCNDYDGPWMKNSWFNVIEQRTSECVSFSICANKTLFGRLAGSDLSDKFVILGSDSEYLYTYDKRLLGENPGGTIGEYLAVRPMILPVMRLRMSEIPEEQLPMDVVFTINIGLSGGRHLVDDVCIKLNRHE